MVVLAGRRWTRALFAVWAQRPLPVLAPWALGSLALGAALLGAALVVALASGPSGVYTPVFADPSAGASDVARIVLRNTAVLTLQVVVCTGVNRGRGLIRCHSVTLRWPLFGPRKRPKITTWSPATTGLSDTRIEMLWRPFGLGCLAACAAPGTSIAAQAPSAAMHPAKRSRMPYRLLAKGN